MIIAYLVIASSLILNTHLSGYNTLFIKVDEEEEEERKKKKREREKKKNVSCIEENIYFHDNA